MIPSGYFESSDEAMDAMRLAGATIMVSSISGKLAADVGVKRFWLHEVDSPSSLHDGEWYWYGPWDQRPQDRFHPVADQQVDDPQAQEGS